MNTLKIEKTKQEAFEKSDTCYSILYLIIVLKLFIFIYIYIGFMSIFTRLFYPLKSTL